MVCRRRRRVVGHLRIGLWSGGVLGTCDCGGEGDRGESDGKARLLLHENLNAARGKRLRPIAAILVKRRGAG